MQRQKYFWRAKIFNKSCWVLLSIETRGNWTFLRHLRQIFIRFVAFPSTPFGKLVLWINIDFPTSWALLQVNWTWFGWTTLHGLKITFMDAGRKRSWNAKDFQFSTKTMGAMLQDGAFYFLLSQSRHNVSWPIISRGPENQILSQFLDGPETKRIKSVEFFGGMHQ